MKKIILLLSIILISIYSFGQIYTIQESSNTGFFEVNGVDYPKGHFSVKYDGSGVNRVFTLFNIYDGKNIISSRSFDEVVGVSSWDELSQLFNSIQIVTYSTPSSTSVNYSLKPFLLAVSMGEVPGYSFIDKFGRTTASAANITVWEGNTDYPEDAFGTADILSIGSTSGSDNQEVSVSGLLVNGDDTTFTVTLSGNTRVALPVALWKVYRAQNQDATNSFVGNVYIYTGTGAVPSTVGDSRNRAIIDNGNNQTLMAVYTIPKDYVGFLIKGKVSISYAETGFFTSVEAIDMFYQSKRVNELFKVKESLSLITSGSSFQDDLRPNYDIIPELTSVKIQIHSTSNTDVAASASFTILLVEEGYLSSGLLQALGMN